MKDDRVGPVEVWLTLQDAGFGVRGRLVFDDESDTDIDVTSLSIRGAQREWTAWLLDQGYKAAGRWQTEAQDSEGTDWEVSRKFAPGENAKPMR